MNLRSFHLGLFVLSAVTFLAAGCGGGTPSTVPVKGTLVFEDGKPVAGASIRFVGAAGSRDASGYTGKDGAFELSTFSTGDGAVPGEYTVVVTKVASTVDSTGTDTSKMSPDDMRKMFEKSKLGAVTPKKIEDPVPAVYGDPKSSPLKQKVDSSSTGITLKLKRN